MRAVNAGAVGSALLVAGLTASLTPPAAAQSMVAPSRAASRPALELAAATKTVHFVGRYHGTAALLIDNGAVTITSVTGTGTGTLLGNSTVEGKGSASASAQCDPFTGKGKLSSSSGKINMSVTESKSSGCSNGESGPVTVTFSGVAVVTGGSGAAIGAAGTMKFSGTLKLLGTTGSENGSYTVTLNGKLTVKK
jgi:hypothetical protein